MAYLLIAVGTLLVLFTLVDTFFTVLNYNQRGLFFNRFLRWQWKGAHWIARGFPTAIRRPFYRSLTGLTLVSGIGLWVAGIVGGFSLVYLGAIQLGHLKVESGAPGGLVGGIYLSIAQFATVGADGLSPQVSWVSVVSAIETLFSVLFLSLVIAFLINIFNSIEALRTLCACFPNSTTRVTLNVDSLIPYLPVEEPTSLEEHLATTRSSMNGYFDSIAADHSALYFYSGKDRFSMPFAVYMVAGTITGIQYGLPPQHPKSKVPELIRLKDSFEGVRSQMYYLLRWKEPEKVSPLGADEFTACAVRAAQIGDASRDRDYVSRFVSLRQSVSEMAELPPPSDWKGEYDRYASWLSFVVLADDFIRRSSHLFDYRPELAPEIEHSAIPITDYGWAK
ncbi:hypothetical protein U6G28_10380 [Actinomycetaceae bacterium MB13-C1-2]|nr:hypothetical protein U6G28_10380 [Actinomycetaceae bacterium MB13-C1-2]